MTMEATAGKNPVSHVGKLYNFAAQHLAETLVAEVAGIVVAECVLASRIGTAIARPALTHLRIALAPVAELADVEPAIRNHVEAAAGEISSLWRQLIAGEAILF